MYVCMYVYIYIYIYIYIYVYIYIYIYTHNQGQIFEGRGNAGMSVVDPAFVTDSFTVTMIIITIIIK